MEITAPTAAAARVTFADFYARTWPDLSSFCRSWVGSGHLADDITQEAFTRLYVRYPLLREPRAYLFRTARNLLIDASRAQRRADATARELGAPPPVPPPDDSVLDAVRRLRPVLRDVVLLHYYADLPVEEVARALRRPLGTVKRRLFEARGELAVTLGETR